MKSLLIVSCFVFCSCLGFAQNDSVPVRKNTIRFDLLRLYRSISQSYRLSYYDPLVCHWKMSYTRYLNQSLQLQFGIINYAEVINYENVDDDWNLIEEKKLFSYVQGGLQWFLTHQSKRFKGLYLTSSILLGYELDEELYANNEDGFNSSYRNEWLIAGNSSGLGYQWSFLKNRLTLDLSLAVLLYHRFEVGIEKDLNIYGASFIGDPHFGVFVDPSLELGFKF